MLLDGQGREMLKVVKLTGREGHGGDRRSTRMAREARYRLMLAIIMICLIRITPIVIIVIIPITIISISISIIIRSSSSIINHYDTLHRPTLHSLSPNRNLSLAPIPIPHRMHTLELNSHPIRILAPALMSIRTTTLMPLLTNIVSHSRHHRH